MVPIPVCEQTEENVYYDNNNNDSTQASKQHVFFVKRTL